MRAGVRVYSLDVRPTAHLDSLANSRYFKKGGVKGINDEVWYDLACCNKARSGTMRFGGMWFGNF